MKWVRYESQGQVQWGQLEGDTISAIDGLHTEYVAGAKANPGKLPIVALDGTQTIKRQNSTNYAPVFKIVGWTARPNDLQSKAGPSVILTRASAPSTGSTKVSAPVADEDDFG